jgi:hypothetical protein
MLLTDPSKYLLLTFNNSQQFLYITTGIFVFFRIQWCDFKAVIRAVFQEELKMELIKRLKCKQFNNEYWM